MRTTAESCDQRKKGDRMKRLPSFGLALGLIFLGSLGGAQAQEKYPTRAIELVVPFGPGGASSVAAHAYKDELARLLKVPVNVVNREGGTGVQGTAYVIRSKKDGYTLLASTDTALVVMPVISKEVTYDPLKDVVPIGYQGYAPSVFAVRSDSPFKTLAELIDFARKNPGKLKNGTSGLGTEAYINLQILCNKEKIKISQIPFKSGGDVATMLLGGHIDMATSALASLSPQLKAGTLRGLAISSKSRNKDFPNIPTTAELGHSEVDLVVWYALFAPAGVPRQVVDVLVPAVEKVFRNPDVVERVSRAGVEVEYKGPVELRKLMESGVRAVKEVAQDAGLAK
jgi:tripartite-type tricarboxylate transporter receptor subunit TctC